MEDRVIDIAIPYVNNNDRVWQKMYMDYCTRYDSKRIASMRNGRFEDIGLINYQLRLVNKYMPWIRTIHLLLSNREQAPKNLPKNVQIHLHREFIPSKYLPTFNSTTIEMFLGNIKGLSEYFIYANDDMLPINVLAPNDFFTNEGRIKINWKKETEGRQSIMFKKQCVNSYQNVAKALGKETKIELMRPLHSFTPMIKSHCLDTIKLLGNVVLSKIEPFRTEFQHNQYIYPIYEDFVYGSERTKIRFYYSQLDESKEELIKAIQNNDIICANLVKNPVNGKILISELEKLL